MLISADASLAYMQQDLLIKIAGGTLQEFQVMQTNRRFEDRSGGMCLLVTLINPAGDNFIPGGVRIDACGTQ
jgi:hypothetical protein